MRIPKFIQIFFVFFIPLVSSAQSLEDTQAPPPVSDDELKEICEGKDLLRNKKLYLDFSSELYDQQTFNSTDNTPWRGLFIVPVSHIEVFEASFYTNNYSGYAGFTYYRPLEQRYHEDTSVILEPTQFDREVVFYRSDSAGNLSAPSEMVYSFNFDSINARSLTGKAGVEGCKPLKGKGRK